MQARAIETTHLSLLPAGEGWLQTLITGPATFALLTDLQVVDGFCEPEGVLAASLDSLRRAPMGERDWWAPFLCVERMTSHVIGLAGFKGPQQYGAVELGYSIAPTHRGRGLATEVVRALAARAFAHREVERVRAHTLPTPNASTRVLEKCGFVRAGEGFAPAEGTVWRWELPRAITALV
jgi:RimJ/RimL family protein N-acetyltransferase